MLCCALEPRPPLAASTRSSGLLDERGPFSFCGSADLRGAVGDPPLRARVARVGEEVPSSARAALGSRSSATEPLLVLGCQQVVEVGPFIRPGVE